MPSLKADHIREYANRDWGLVEQIKDECWLEAKREYGPEESLRIAADLYEHVVAVRPDWPDEEERRADLEAHIRLAELLTRVKTP